VGDHVDVVATVVYPTPEGETAYAISTMLVENVLVLKTGLAAVDETETGAIYQTVTLSVIPDDALRINYAASNGAIRLILRPVLDDKLVKPKDFPVITDTMALETNA
jgi:Flp pilus assembly protein CpaB